MLSLGAEMSTDCGEFNVGLLNVTAESSSISSSLETDQSKASV